MSTAILSLAFALTAATLASGQAIPEIPPEIVSAWKLDAGNLLLIFRHDGTYTMADGSGTQPGMERGTFVWDKASSEFSVTTLRDTNGDAGLSHPEGATTLTISGNTLTYAVAGEGSSTFTRVVNTTSAIVGSWFIPGEYATLTFLADGSYYHTEESNRAPDDYDGMERGTFSWNPGTGALSSTVQTDTNGDVGLSNPTPAFTVTVSGNQLTIFDGEETYQGRRITPILSPLNTENDFEIDQFSNYRQTSAAAPALLPVPATEDDDYPFWGEAYIEIENRVPGSDGTLTIASQAPRTFEEDEYEDEDGNLVSDWFLAEEYPSLSELNQASAFPNGANYVFARSGGSATLSFPAGGTFPNAPQIVGADDKGSWSAGNYLLGKNQTLIWGAHTAYDPASLVTVISVVDQATEEEILHETVLQGDLTSYDFSGKLTPGSSYDVILEHVKIAGSTTAGTGPFAGKLGYALYNSNTRFTMVAPDEPADLPTIELHPLSQQPDGGATVTLTVRTQEDDPSQTFQWYKDDEPIPGQTGNSLFIFGFDADTHSGSYQVLVSNSAGNSMSAPADVGNVEPPTPAVNSIVTYKRRIFEQQSTSLLAETGASFGAWVDGMGITPTFPASSITLVNPNNTSISLAFDGEVWESVSEFASFAAMQPAFPDGSYNINIGSTPIPIDMEGSFPNQPLVTSSAGTWVNGKLRLTASQAATAVTLTSNASTGNGFVALLVTDSDGMYIVDGYANTSPSDPGFVTAQIGAGELEVGESYKVGVEFNEDVYSAELSSYSWSSPPPDSTRASGFLATTTVFTIEVVPDPPADSYTTWQSGFFNSAQLADPAISGAEADPDRDGLANLLECLFGGQPLAVNSNLQPTLTTTSIAGGRNLVFTYRRKLDAAGITQVIESAADLSSPWTPAVHGQNGVTITTSAVDAATEQVTVTIPTTGTKAFVRLRASR